MIGMILDHLQLLQPLLAILLALIPALIGMGAISNIEFEDKFFVEGSYVELIAILLYCHTIYIDHYHYLYECITTLVCFVL